jgi:hypothetical protein
MRMNLNQTLDPLKPGWRSRSSKVMLNLDQKSIFEKKSWEKKFLSSPNEIYMDPTQIASAFLNITVVIVIHCFKASCMPYCVRMQMKALWCIAR